MSDEAALLAAVRTHPDEDTPRLMYADWLDEHGNADRAEFIRTQVALPTIAEEDDCRTALELRERQLLAAHATEWTHPRPVFPTLLPFYNREERKGYWSVFRRGFLEAIGWHDLSLDHLKPGGEFEQVFAAHPVRELRLRYFLPGSLLELAARPELERIEALELTYFGNRNDPDHVHEERINDVEAFLHSPRLKRLRSLTLTLFPTPFGPRVRWLRLPVFAQLQKLQMWPRNGERNEFWIALAHGCCPELIELDTPWGHERETMEIGRHFTNSDACKRLKSLRLSMSIAGTPFPWSNMLTNAPLQELQISTGSGTNIPDALAALAETPPTNQLRRLRIFGITATGAGAADWLKSGYAVGVRQLHLESLNLNDSDLQQLAEAPGLARLTRLTVSGYSASTSEGLQRLFASPHLTGLRYLNASATGLTAEAALCLADRGSCRGLREVNLGQLRDGNGDSTPAVPAVLNLGKGKQFPHLHTIETWAIDEKLKAEEFRELLDSRQLPNLTVFRVGFHERKLEEWKKLVANTRLAWVGGHMSNEHSIVDHVALFPQNVFLPNHLDDFRW